jgi:hypothetical protein
MNSPAATTSAGRRFPGSPRFWLRAPQATARPAKYFAAPCRPAPQVETRPALCREPSSEPGTKRIVWTTPSKQERSGMLRRGRVRSCVRPTLRGLMTAGPDAIRSLAPKQIYALEWRITLDGFFQAPGSTGSPLRHHRYRRAPVSTKSTLRPPHCEHLSRLTQSTTATSAP